MGRRTTLAARCASLALLGVLAACGASAEPTSFTGTRLDPPFEVSSTPLTDTGGDDYSLAEDADKDLTLLFFGYTNCPDISGHVMPTLAGTLTRLHDEQRDRVDVVFVTTDPHRDDRQVVEDYVQAYAPSIVGLTGELDEIVPVAASVKVAIGYFDRTGAEIQPADLPQTGYEVEHGTQVFGMGPDGDVDEFWGADVSQAQLTRDVLTLLDEG